MTADRERQLARLDELNRAFDGTPGYHANDGRTFFDYLLDNGVTVDVPEPVIAPGTTGWATVRGIRGMRLIRGPVKPDTGAWFSGMAVDGDHWHWDRNVTDFVPDPDPLTAEAVDRIITEAGKFGGTGVRSVLERDLAPYVAKGGA